MSITIADIHAARQRMGTAIMRTPTVRAAALSDLFEADIWLKLETLHYIGSFKERGALNKLLTLSPDERRVGVIASSAGNHAQGVAFHARRLGIPATIVMPISTPFTKVERTERLGAKVELVGETVAEAARHALERSRAGRLVFVHPYDDTLIIAGQGTAGLEMMEDVSGLDCIVTAIGGGGLIAGIAIAAKSIDPKIEIIGVQSALYPSMAAALGRTNEPSGGDTIADGIAVSVPGRLTVPIIEREVRDILLVSEAELESAVMQLAETTRILGEGAGVAPLAGLLQDPKRFKGRRVGLVIGGGNIDARLLSSVLLRGLLHDRRLVQIRVEIPDRPGMLARTSQVIGENGGNIVEIVHQRLFGDVPVKRTQLDLLIETRNGEHLNQIMRALNQAGLPVRDLPRFSQPNQNGRAN
jgi:threonine dehydratase